MKKVGIVKQKAEHEGNRFGVLMHDDDAPLVKGKQDVWFNGFGPTPKRFDKIEFEWDWDNEEEKKYRNIDGEVNILESSGESSQPEAQPPQKKLSFDNGMEFRNRVTKFVDECVQDAFDIWRNRSESEKKEINVEVLIDQVRRTRIYFILNKEG